MKSKGSIKGHLQSIIYKLLQEKNEVYGYEIIKFTKNRTHGNLQITEAALYSVLHKMENEGFLEVEMKNIGNRNRKYYRLTNQGKKESISQLNKIHEYIQSLQLIFYPEIKTT